MLTVTDKAQGKVKEILDSQPEPFAGLRVQVVGGGCSGFQYHMGFEKQGNSSDEVLDMGSQAEAGLTSRARQPRTSSRCCW